MEQLKHFYHLAKKSVEAWIDDYAPSMGAAISYYTVFSIAPLLLIVIAVAGAVWGREAVQGEIVAQLSGLIGEQGATGVQALIESANKPTQGLVAGTVSLVVLVIGATTVFAELQSALDRVWEVPPAQKMSSLWATLRSRLLSLGFILGLGFLMAVSLVFSAGLAALGSWADTLLPGWETLFQLINTAISLGITTVLFALIFKLMPQAKIGWKDVWIGAAVTAVLFEVGKTLIGLYIGKSSVTSSFAAAGSLVVLLIWVYYSAQIFLLGAEFTWVYAHEDGSLASAQGHTGAAAQVPQSSRGPSASHAPASAQTGRSDRPWPDSPSDAIARHGAIPRRSQPAPVMPATPAAPRVPVTLPSASGISLASAALPGSASSSAAPRQDAALPTQRPPASARRPTLRQRLIVYSSTAAAFLMLHRLLKRHEHLHR